MKLTRIKPAIVREFIGHDSPAISAKYTHIEMTALKKAAGSPPSLLDDRETPPARK